MTEKSAKTGWCVDLYERTSSRKTRGWKFHSTATKRPTHEEALKFALELEWLNTYFTVIRREGDKIVRIYREIPITSVVTKKRRSRKKRA